MNKRLKAHKVSINQTQKILQDVNVIGKIEAMRD